MQHGSPSEATPPDERLTYALLPTPGNGSALSPDQQELLALLLEETPVQAAASSASDDRLITLQGEGAGPALFAVGVFHFQLLADQLGTSRPFYGLLGQDLDAEVPYLNQVGELAKRYVDTLLQAQPEGPYHLIGFCFGGIVAYEVARQLRARGASMGALILVDAVPPMAPSSGETHARSGRLARHWSALKDEGGKYVIEWAKRRRVYERQRAERLGKRSRLRPGIESEVGQTGQGHAMEQFEAQVIAANSYVPGGYEGDALVVMGTAHLDQPVGEQYDAGHAAGRWRDHISGSVDVNVLHSKTHNDLLKEPLLVERLAALIQKEIAWVDEKESGQGGSR